MSQDKPAKEAVQKAIEAILDLARVLPAPAQNEYEFCVTLRQRAPGLEWTQRHTFRALGQSQDETRERVRLAAFAAAVGLRAEFHVDDGPCQ